MQMQMPQEIEVWFILPALRRELAKAMISDCNLTQKAVADHMNITEAAISMYLKSKRASDITFSKQVKEEIKKSAQSIVAGTTTTMTQMIKLCKLPEVKQVMCDLHKKQKIELPSDCDICFEPSLIKVQ